MKELSTEEKAKAYDEALKVLHKYDGANIMFSQSLKEEMFPELKESEDERIRKNLVKHFEDRKRRLVEMKDYTKPSNYPFDELQLCQNALAWLEKQGKEQELPQECETKDGETITYSEKDGYKIEPKFKVGDTVKDPFGNVYHITEINNDSYKTDDGRFILFENEDAYTSFTPAWLEKQGEQKPVDTSGVNSSIPMIELDTIDDYIEYLENLHRMDDELSLKHLQLKEWLIELKTLREQKPEWSEKDEECFKEVELNFKLNHDDMTPALVECYNRFFAKLKSLKDRVQPVQEWSEKDEDYFDAIITKLEVTQEDAALTDNQMNFLKSLKSKIHLKQEWNEEDENMIRYIGNAITCKESSKYLEEKGVDMIRAHRWLESLKPQFKQEWSEEDDIYIENITLAVEKQYPTAAKDIVDWLKSLKPQPKQEWSEEDSLRLQRIIDFLQHNRKGDTDTIYQQEQDIDWLKSLRFQKQWKPSEKQINALNDVLSLKYIKYDVLSELLKCLKKLK